MSVATVATDVVKYALAIARTPQGQAEVLALGGPVASLIVNFGLVGLGSVLETWAQPTISEEQVASELATKGVRVVAFDPASLWGAP